jgi:cardiolipin synthase
MYDPSLSPSGTPHSSDCCEKSSIEDILGVTFTENNYVRLLRSGQEIFEAIFSAIKDARQIICIEFYIIKDDSTGRRFAELLKEKAKQGVQVYILYDHFGSFGTPVRFWRGLHKAGISLRISHPIKWSAPHHHIHRDHKKLLIIDGDKAFTGGFNIGDEYHGYLRKRKEAWRDTGIYLEGPIAAVLLEIFKKSWSAWKGKRIEWGKEPLASEEGVSVIPILTSSARGRKKLRKLFFYSISNAKNTILLTNAYFSPSKRMLTVMEDAVRRGVKIKLLLPGKSDFLPVFYASRGLYDKLLSIGAEIYVYQERILHAKSAVFDSNWSIIGSANLDFQSLRRNDESNVGVFDSGFAQQMTETFMEDLNHSVKISKEAWSKRPFYEKVIEKFFLLFRKRL